MDRSALVLPPRNKCVLHKQVLKIKKNKQHGEKGDEVVNTELNSPLSNERTTAAWSIFTIPGLDSEGVTGRGGTSGSASRHLSLRYFCIPLSLSFNVPLHKFHLSAFADLSVPFSSPKYNALFHHLAVPLGSPARLPPWGFQQSAGLCDGEPSDARFLFILSALTSLSCI